MAGSLWHSLVGDLSLVDLLGGVRLPPPRLIILIELLVAVYVFRIVAHFLLDIGESLGCDAGKVAPGVISTRPKSQYRRETLSCRGVV